MNILQRGALAAVGLVLATAVSAQAYPAKSIRLVVPFEAGGTVDSLGRSVAAQITKQSGANIYIDNKPGANAVIGTVEVAKAPPDGYTVLNISPSLVLNPALKTKLPYELSDFVPITALGIGAGYLIVTKPDLPVNSLAELVALARKADNSLTYGTPGIGNAIHIATEMFAQKAKIKLLHVPYKGSAGALNAITAGQVDVMVLSPPTVIPLAASNKLRVLAFTGDSRSPEFPNVPTLKEAGIDDLVIKGTWVGWFAPAGTPPQVVSKLHQEVSKALKAPEVSTAMSEGGFTPDGRSPAEFARFVKDESKRFADIVQAIGLEKQE